MATSLVNSQSDLVICPQVTIINSVPLEQYGSNQHRKWSEKGERCGKRVTKVFHCSKKCHTRTVCLSTLLCGFYFYYKKIIKSDHLPEVLPKPR